jgi:hypothetical protein
MIANESNECSTANAMEHHTLERPRIAAERRRPTVTSMKFDIDPLKNVTVGSEQLSSGKELSREKVVPQPLLETSNENSSKKINLKPSMFSFSLSKQGLKHAENASRITPKNQKITNEFASVSQVSIDEKNNIRKKVSSSKLHPENAEVLLPESSDANVVLMDAQSVPINIPVKRTPRSFPKWVQVLGFPMTAQEVEAEKIRIAESARKQGASRDEILFMLRQIVPMADEQVRIQAQREKVEFLRGRLLLGSVRGVDDSGTKSKTLTKI